ncbi:MAG: FecR domain-containing protein [Gammaproteobacteria bacterium]
MDIEAQATRWLVRLDATRSPELIAQHAKWMAESARHRVAYMKLSLAWKRMDALRRTRPWDPPGEVDPDLLKPRTRFWSGADMVLGALRAAWIPRLGVGLTMAAAFAILAAALIQPDTQIAYSAPVGGHEHVTLDDGSVLDLNTDTRIRVQFTAARRQIFLDHGEVLLAAAHDASRPLEVIAAGVVTRAVGTKFSVRIYDNTNVETVVTEGRVLVLREQRTLGLRTAPKPLVRTIVAGERVVVDSRAAHVSKLSAKQIERTLQWTTGRIAFHEEKLSDVVGELNRYNARRLVILDSHIAGTKVGGGFDTSRADAYAEDLMKFFGPNALGSASE